MIYIGKPNKTKSTTKRNGIVAIPIVIGITILIASVAIVISTLGFNEVVNSSRLSDASRAMLYAESGVKDALQRIHFNKNYEETTGYEIDFSDDDSNCDGTPEDGCATVKVYSKIGGTVLSPSVIVSEGRYKDNFRTLNVGVVTKPDNSGRILNAIRYEVKSLPVVFTGQATSIGSESAVLNGWVNPNDATASDGINDDVTAWFRYDTVQPDVCSDSLANSASVSASPFTGTNPTSFSSNSLMLSKNTTYYYCAIVDDDASSTNKVYGRLYSFTTSS